MKAGSPLPAALGAGVVLAGALLLSGRHELTKGRRAIDSAFSEFDAALRAEEEMVPGILTATRPYAGEEEPALDEMASALAAATAAHTRAEKIAAAEPLEIALAKMLLIQEVHPESKSNAAVAALQTALARAEARMAAAQRKYNEAVQQYNATLAAFPQSVAGAAFGFRREEDEFKADSLIH
ncbi:MAG TPA: LemA family protein [Bryobacteraceae bacterium]|nr:LemA family protein [Bryobacteraceae bacterium]